MISYFDAASLNEAANVNFVSDKCDLDHLHGNSLNYNIPSKGNAELSVPPSFFRLLCEFIFPLPPYPQSRQRTHASLLNRGVWGPLWG
jgi:hypothetical protein